MGCVGSKVQNTVVVAQCKQRMRYVKRAMKSHNGFAIAHANYLAALKTIGAAFLKFAQLEFIQQQSMSPGVSSTPDSSPFLPRYMEASSSSTMEASSSSAVTTPRQPMAYQNTPFPSKTVIVSPLPPRAYENTPSVSERVVLAPIRVMAYQNTPFGSETVTISPSRSPDNQNSWSYQEYLYNDAPPPGIYSNIPTPPSQSEPNFHGGSEPAEYQGSPSPPPSMFTAGWEWLDLFSVPPMSIHFQEPTRYKREDMKQVMEEEDIPPLEVEGTPPREIKVEQTPPPEIKVEQKKDEIEEVKEDEPEGVKSENEVKAENVNSKVGQNEVLQKEGLQEDSHERITNLKPLKLEPEDKYTTKDMNETKTRVPQKSRNMLELLTEIDVQFGKASESGRNVFRVLEASKIHHHLNFGDLRGRFAGIADHSSRFFSSVSRGHWSPRTPLSSASTSTSASTSEDSTAEDPSLLGSHSSTLDKLYAWEKKLYKEVKELESTNIEYERKRRHLQKLDARGEGDDKIDKIRASLKALETELIVAGQAMDVTLSAIRNLTDDELHPQLLELLEELTIMWREMFACHQHQRDAVSFMRIPEDQTLESTSNFQWQATKQLESALDNLLSNFSAVMNTQREYIQNLHKWLNTSLFRPERESKQTAASLSTRAKPRIYYLCQRWQHALDKLPDRTVVHAIKEFLKIVRDIINLQSQEIRIKKNLDILTKDLTRKIQALNNAQIKHANLVKAKDQNSANDEFAIRGPVEDRRDEVERQRTKVEKEREIYLNAIQVTRTSTLNKLKMGLPELFQALSEFASQCSQAHESLYSQSKNGKLASE
ncbi:hypothetical protein O6H91_Y208000 [Diphasiastrum complanatum]|nr:hypothetical protein O6H91_Y208000 [Diphasiastrum complanatum]